MSGDSRTGEKQEGVIGLGLLGSAIAARLLDEGFEVIGLDADPVRGTELGVETVSSAVELASRGERVVLCLPGSGAGEEVCVGSEGLLDAG